MKFVLPLLAVGAFVMTANADDLFLDQIGAADGSDVAGQNTYASQYFEAGYEVYHVAAMDDFVMPYDGYVTSVEAVISGWNGYAGLNGVVDYSILFFNSPQEAGAGPTLLAASVAAVLDVQYDSVQLAFTGTSLQDLVQFNTNVALSAGTYWVAVLPENPFGTNGQTGAMGSVLGDLNAYQANPAGGFGFPNGYQMIDPPMNLAYRLYGTEIPAPGALALLGLAGLARRRRR
jgi:hypothetical protein